MACCDSDSILATTFFLSTSSIEIILVFCFSRNSSISFRKVFPVVFGIWDLGFVCFSKMGSTFFCSGFCGVGSGLGDSGFVSGFGVLFDGESSWLISSSGVNEYRHIIFSWNLNGFAKSLMFLRATRIAGSSSSSLSSFLSLSFR